MPEQDDSEPDDGFETESETRSAEQDEEEEQLTEPDRVEPEGFPTEPAA
jgi:hypothetical protein